MRLARLPYHHRLRRVALLLIVSVASSLLLGCGPSGPGLTDQPPPKGGPKAGSERRPPGEVDSPKVR